MTPSKSNPVRQRAISQTSFIVVVAVLLLSAIALNTATQKLGLVFKKLPVPQPREYATMPALMGKWLQISVDEKLDKETQDVLGTEKYIYRDYIEVDKCGSDFLQMLVSEDGGDHPQLNDAKAGEIRESFNSKKTFDERAKLIQAELVGKTGPECKVAMSYAQSRNPYGVMNMGLTYYTGMVDTVAHVPDRCYIADGMDMTNAARIHPIWNLGNDKSLEVRFMHFQDQTDRNRPDRIVAYFFHVDGNFAWDPLDVRRQLQSLTQKYGYYAKTELMQVGTNEDTVAKAMTDFLTAAKPQIEKCLPDWEKVNGPK